MKCCRRVPPTAIAEYVDVHKSNAEKKTSETKFSMFFRCVCRLADSVGVAFSSMRVTWLGDGGITVKCVNNKMQQLQVASVPLRGTIDDGSRSSFDVTLSEQTTIWLRSFDTREKCQRLYGKRENEEKLEKWRICIDQTWDACLVKITIIIICSIGKKRCNRCGNRAHVIALWRDGVALHQNEGIFLVHL